MMLLRFDDVVARRAARAPCVCGGSRNAANFRRSPRGFPPTASADVRRLAQTFSRGGRRDHALLLTLYNSGARVSEIAAIRRSQIISDSTTSLILQGKGHKERSVPLCAKTARILELWLKEVSGSPAPDTIETMIQMPSFICRTELGNAAATRGPKMLAPLEMAAALSS